MKNNDAIEKSILLRLTQKLCDRIIFILFAEDRGLLHSNTIKEIIAEFNDQKFTDYKLFDIYKFYFNAKMKAIVNWIFQNTTVDYLLLILKLTV